MVVDFSFWLVVATVVSGLVWAADTWYFRPRRLARATAGALPDEPIAAWIATSNIWRGMNSLSFRASSAPRDCALSRCTMSESASTGSPFTRMSSLIRSPGR